MGKGGALNAWLREFCSLVFTQTLQAFIYAIIITLVLISVAPPKVEGENEPELKTQYRAEPAISNTAMGLINIFALTSIFKIEDMARRIFGLQKSGVEVKSPLSSMAKLGFMSYFGRRLWDNGRKIVKGGFGIAKSRRTARKDRRKLDKQIANKVAQYNKVDSQLNGLSSEEAVPVAGTAAITGAALGTALSSTGTSSMNVSTLHISAGSVNMNGGPSQDNADRRQKLEDKRDALRDAILELESVRDDKTSAANKELQNSIHMLASGVTETIGATLGATLGAVIGGADGRDMSHGMVVGMSAGDRIGQGAVDLGFSGYDLYKDIKKDMKVRKSNKAPETKILHDYIDMLKEESENATKAMYDNLQEEIRKRSKDTNNEINNM